MRKLLEDMVNGNKVVNNPDGHYRPLGLHWSIYNPFHGQYQDFNNTLIGQGGEEAARFLHHGDW